MTAATIEVAGRTVGAGHPVFVVGEISANHGGDLARTLDLVDAAADAGVDAIKVQTYTADSLTIDSSDERFVVGPGNPWTGRRLHDLYAEAAMPWDWYPTIAERAAARDVILFSTPFDRAAVDFLVAHACPVLKIASFELTDLPLIEAAAATGLPLICSTGMATIDEIDDAVSAVVAAGGSVALLRCNSAYPSPPADMDLRSITDMAERWPVPIGLSDHTLDDVAATVAVSLGASVVEKHITLDRSDGGPDSSFSLEPAELARLVRTIRTAEAALGNVRYGPSASDRDSLKFRRGIYVIKPLRRGEAITADHVGTKRPVALIEPRYLPDVVDRVATRDLPVGHALDWGDLAST